MGREDMARVWHWLITGGHSATSSVYPFASPQGPLKRTESSAKTVGTGISIPQAHTDSLAQFTHLGQKSDLVFKPSYGCPRPSAHFRVAADQTFAQSHLPMSDYQHQPPMSFDYLPFADYPDVYGYGWEHRMPSYPLPLHNQPLESQSQSLNLPSLDQTPHTASTPASQPSTGSVTDDDSATATSPEAYAHLLFLCLSTAPGHQLPLGDIYEWVRVNSSKARDASGSGWQNSIRHNLSMNKDFSRVDSTNTKCTIWQLNPDAVARGFVYSTTTYRKTTCRRRPKSKIEKSSSKRANAGYRGGIASQRAAAARRAMKQDKDTTESAQSGLNVLSGPEPSGMEQYGIDSSRHLSPYFTASCSASPLTRSSPLSAGATPVDPVLEEWGSMSLDQQGRYCQRRGNYCQRHPDAWTHATQYVYGNVNEDLRIDWNVGRDQWGLMDMEVNWNFGKNV